MMKRYACNALLATLLPAIIALLQPVYGAAADSAADIPAPASASGGQGAMLVPAVARIPGSVIGSVTIENSNIFDLDDPGEDRALFRLANYFHVTTRPEVIQQQLLFQAGDAFSRQALEESERILRANRYIHAASIQPVQNENGVVDVNVETSDVWTLMPRLSLSRSGGKNTTSVGLREQNLLGSGAAIEVFFRSDVDRDTRTLKYADRNLGSSWYGLRLEVDDNSDGYSQFLEIGQPFYSLDSRSAQGLSAYREDSIGTFYTRGEAAAEFRDEASGYEVYGGWSNGLKNGWARRYTAGVSYDDHRFSAVADSAYPVSAVPRDRRFLTPFFGVEVVEDRYEKSSNHDQINRIEDRYLGTLLRARLGVAGESMGSDRDALLLDVALQTGFGTSERSSLILASALRGRAEESGIRNLALDVSASYHKRQSERRLLYASLSGAYGHNLDLDEYFVLGGDTGLRGYPLRYQTGDKRALLTIEQRYFTNWHPFQLFHVGGAVFLDVGRTWGKSPLGVSGSRLLRDIGLGLRIGSDRSGLGRMLHVDLAFPLDNENVDNLQFLVSTRKSF